MTPTIDPLCARVAKEAWTYDDPRLVIGDARRLHPRPNPEKTPMPGRLRRVPQTCLAAPFSSQDMR